MGDRFERGYPYEPYEMFDAIHAAGMPPAELPGEMEEGGLFEGRHTSAGAPPLVSYGASSTLRYDPGADAIPTSVTMPAGAEPATPVPEPSPAPQELGSPLSERATTHARAATREQRPQSDERERSQHMDKWEDSATSATAMNEAHPTSATTPGGATGATGVSAEGQTSTPQVSEWTEEVVETEVTPGAARIALIAGSATLGALAIAGGVTWLIIQRRRISAAREMERAIAASRLLRFTPAAARPYMLEAAKARESAMQLAQQSAAETARMARALGQAASVSANVARDYATERTSTAQGAITGAYNTAVGGANTALRTISTTAPVGTRWMRRIFNAGRFTGRLEQRLK